MDQAEQYCCCWARFWHCCCQCCVRFSTWRFWHCCCLLPRTETVYCSSGDHGFPPSDYLTVNASSTEYSSMKKTEGEEQSSSVATDTIMMQATAQKTQKPRRDETGQPATDSGPTPPTDEIVARPEGELLP